MSIRSFVGNVANSVNNDLQSVMITAKTAIQNVVGSVETGISTLWSGGFAGIDEKHFDIIKSALNEYCNKIEAKINEFNQMNKLEVAYKGSIQVAADDFVGAVKDILTAYVTTMRRNIAESDTAFQNYKERAENIATDVINDAEQVRQEAKKVRLD